MEASSRRGVDTACGAVLCRLGENLLSQLIAREGPRRTGIRFDLDESLDDLLFRDTVVQCDAQLAAQGLLNAENSRMVTETSRAGTLSASQASRTCVGRRRR